MGDALHSESAEFRVFLADLPGGLEIRGSTPSLNRLEAVELIDGDARAWRRPFEHNDILPGGDAAPACRLDRGLDNRQVLFLERVQVRNVRLGDDIDRRLGLSMEALNRDSADCSARLIELRRDGRACSASAAAEEGGSTASSVASTPTRTSAAIAR